jgi:hypothetical protein
MSIYDINLADKVLEWLAPNKRYEHNVEWLRANIKTLQRLQHKYLTDYRIGSSYPEYISGATYNTGDVVKIKQVLYESTIDNNTVAPPNTTWVMYLPSFIGVDERVRFNGQKLVLEYALNEYFFSTFRQPPLTSDIYITNNAYVLAGFLVSSDDTGSTVASVDIYGQSIWSNLNTYAQYDLVQYNGFLFYSKTNGNIGHLPSENNYWHKTEDIGRLTPFIQGDNFTIHMPAVVYAGTNENDIRQFVDKIIPIGLIYNIVTY